MQVRQLLSEREFLFILKYRNNVYGAFIYLITVVCCVGTGVDVSVNYFSIHLFPFSLKMLYLLFKLGALSFNCWLYPVFKFTPLCC